MPQSRCRLSIIWHCEQYHTAYNPTRYKAVQRILAEETGDPA